MKQEKLDMLLDLLEHPENYTESQKDELLADSEVKDIYQQMVETREALDYQKSKEEMAMPSVSDEWEKLKRTKKSEETKYGDQKKSQFNCYSDDATAASKQDSAKQDTKVNPSSRIIHLWSPMRKVAAIAAVLVISGIAFAAIHLATHSHQTNTPQHQEVVAERNDSAKQATSIANSASNEKADSVSSEKLPLVYENAELQAILPPIAQHFHLKVVYQNEASRHIRLYLQLTEGMSLEDIIELMNHFEKVNIRHEGETLIVE